MNMKIRLARAEDYPVLLQLFNDASREHKIMRPDIYRDMDETLPSLPIFKIMIAGKKLGLFNSLAMLVAHRDDQIPIGAIYMESIKRVGRSWSAFKKTACIENVIVNSEFRRQGIGSALIESGKGWAKNTGHAYLTAKVLDNNAASLAMFTKSGVIEDFRILGCKL